MARVAVHDRRDSVGVAIEDIRTGDEIEAVYIIDKFVIGRIKALGDIPLGHKIALKDIGAGEKIIKYGRPIGVATRDIKAGEHVHTHNLKSIRWGALERR